MRRGLAAAGLAALVITGCGRPAPPPPATSTGEQTHGITSMPPSTAVSGYSFPYQPLWPFTEPEDADRWLVEARPAGSDLWHADPRATALKFTREFLAFSELDRTTTVTEQPKEAWVGIGQSDPTGTGAVNVANLHLARFGPAADAPWVVVGTEDTALTLDRPAYGSPVQPVVEVGGVITGVDESLRIQARQLSAVVGEYCCVPAGGQRTPWSATLSISATRPGPVTVVVSTGGHYAAVERFAVTALRAN